MRPRDGNGVGVVEGWDLCSCPTWFCLAPFSSHLVWHEKISCPIPAHWGLMKPRPTSPRKTLLFINFPHKYYNFLIKHVSLIKIYLKLQLNLSYQIKLFFSKNYIILFKCIFNKIISQQQQQQQKKKIQSITNNKIEAKSHVG